MKKLLSKVGHFLERGEKSALEQPHRVYGTALARILLGLAGFLIFAVNFPVRHYLWGSAAQWTAPYLNDSRWGSPWQLFASLRDTSALFTVVYLIFGLTTFCMMVGFFTRTSMIISLYLSISLMTTNPLAADQGDNAWRILVFFLCFTQASRVWSVDSWLQNRKKLSPSRHSIQQTTPDKTSAETLHRSANPLTSWIPNWTLSLLHNTALIAILLQLCVIYTQAGLEKVPGNLWREGTATYYPLQVARFSPWPELNNLITDIGFGIAISSLATIFFQTWFAPMILTRWTRALALFVLVPMHLAIALFMGLGTFSLTMLAADFIIVSDGTFRTIEAWTKNKIVAWRSSRKKTQGSSDGEASATLPSEAEQTTPSNV